MNEHQYGMGAIRSKEFHITEDKFYRGTAEFSEIQNSTAFFSSLERNLKISIPKSEKPWFFFNRLFVNPKIRNRGVASSLLEKVEVWANEEEFNIFLNINPYGDLNLHQLVILYSKFRFKLISFEHKIMTRLINP